MLGNISEKEILEYLMTSDFSEGLTQEESKFLLLKYRYHYRVLYAKNEQMVYISEEREKEINLLKDKINSLSSKINELSNEINSEKIRPLSWKERITGKKIKKDGYK